MRAFFLTIAILLTAYYLLLTTAYADVSSQPIYGGGQMFMSQGFISIDKKVANPESQGSWMDNLTINDPKYNPESSINFQINLTNTGNTEIKQINVKDVFPQLISFGSGPGNFDPNTKTLSFEVNNLKPKENRTFIVVGKVVSGNQLPVSIGTICMVNQATATTNDSGMSQDNTQFCVQKEVLGTQTPLSKAGLVVLPPPSLTTTPATGGESIVLFSLIPTGVIGFFLRKYSSVRKKPPLPRSYDKNTK